MSLTKGNFSENSVASTPADRNNELAPLLPAHDGCIHGTPGNALDLAYRDGESFDDVPKERRQLGLVSAIFLIFNRIIGTGIYATPSQILRSCGSVGLSLAMWLLGALIAGAGTAVFVELGTGIPRNGGEKNYLETIFRRPKYLVTCLYATLIVFIGWSSSSVIIIGQYLVLALDFDPTPSNIRLIGAGALTSSFLLHGTRLKLGLRIQNALGICIMLIMLFIALVGTIVLIFPSLAPDVQTDNLEWDNIWAGTRFETNAFVTALYSVTWSFVGYSNANYALSEMRDPVRTIKRAAPIAVIAVTCLYMLVNISYFAVVRKEDVLNSGQTVAALFFRNLFGAQSERLVCIIIALSCYGSLMACMFAQGRTVQELGREGILPFSSIFASNKPFDTPFAGLCVAWLMSLLEATIPPLGDSFNFVIQLSSYPMIITNIGISAGLFYLRRSEDRQWNPPFRSWSFVIAFFLVANVLLAVVPLIPPAPGFAVYEHLPYYIHVVVSLLISALGALYWYVKFNYLPRKKGYVLVQETVIQDNDISRSTFKKISVN